MKKKKLCISTLKQNKIYLALDKRSFLFLWRFFFYLFISTYIFLFFLSLLSSALKYAYEWKTIIKLSSWNWVEGCKYENEINLFFFFFSFLKWWFAFIESNKDVSSISSLKGREKIRGNRLSFYFLSFFLSFIFSTPTTKNVS